MKYQGGSVVRVPSVQDDWDFSFIRIASILVVNDMLLGSMSQPRNSTLTILHTKYETELVYLGILISFNTTL